MKVIVSCSPTLNKVSTSGWQCAEFLVFLEVEHLFQGSPPHDDLPQLNTVSPADSGAIANIKTTPVHSALLSFKDDSPKSSFCPEDYCFDALFTAPIFRVLSPALKGSQILTVCALTQAESQYPLSVCIKDTSSRPVEGLAAGQWAHVWRQQWKQTKDRK